MKDNKIERVEIRPPFIKLDSLLKFCGAAETGGHAKELVQTGCVQVNGQVCLQRGKKIAPGAVVTLDGVEYHVAEQAAQEAPPAE